MNDVYVKVSLSNADYRAYKSGVYAFRPTLLLIASGSLEDSDVKRLLSALTFDPRCSESDFQLLVDVASALYY